MNSTTSSTCVQLASLLSRTPSAAEMESPLAQMPRKPASSTIRALNPLCASIKNSSRGERSISRNCVVFRMSVARGAVMKASRQSSKRLPRLHQGIIDAAAASPVTTLRGTSMITTATLPINDSIRDAVAEQDEAALRRQYNEQDEFVVVEDFLP